MLTTAGSTRLAISANEAESASGARAICMSGCATVGRPDNIAPMPMPPSKHATASAAIQTRSFLRMVRSCSVVLLLEKSNIFHHLRKNQAPAKGLEYSERVVWEQKTSRVKSFGRVSRRQDIQDFSRSAGKSCLILSTCLLLRAQQDFEDAFRPCTAHRMDAF